LKNYDFLDEFDDNVVDKHFVRSRRVELDAVLSAVGSERLWEYIMHKLIELSPTRDYNRAISMPAKETLYHKTLQDFLVYVNWYVDKTVKDEETKIQDELENVEGMIDVDEKSNEIQTRLENKVNTDDEGMNLMVSKVDEILKALPKMDVTKDDVEEDENDSDDT
jgi:hypothetical protein